MANHVLQKLGSMFTAAILCASCLPFGSVSAAGNNTADADISETIPNLVKSPEQLVQDAERGDFLTLSYATLLDCAYSGAGYASTFSEKNQTLLDVDHSGRIDSTDIFLLMYWCAYQGATGDYTEDSITFLGEWDARKRLCHNRDHTAGNDALYNGRDHDHCRSGNHCLLRQHSGNYRRHDRDNCCANNGDNNYYHNYDNYDRSHHNDNDYHHNEPWRCMGAKGFLPWRGRFQVSDQHRLEGGKG